MQRAEVQLRELSSHGTRQELIFSDVMTGRLMSRHGWDELMDRASRRTPSWWYCRTTSAATSTRGFSTRAALTRRNINIVAIRESIDTADDSAAAKHFCRMMMAYGACLADSTSKRIKVDRTRQSLGETAWHPPALTPDQVNEWRRMFPENPSMSGVARIMKISRSPAKGAIFE